MADLTEQQSAGTVKLTGADSLGLETYYLDVDSSGRVTVNQGAAGAANWLMNIAAFGGSAVALGQAVMASSIPVVLASNQSSIPVTQSGTWTTARSWTLSSGGDSVAAVQSGSWSVTANIGSTNGLALDATLTGGTQRTKITDGINNAAVKAASTAAAATDPALVVAVSPNNTVAVTQSGTWTVQQGSAPWSVSQSGSPWGMNLTQVGGSALALGQTTMASSIPVALASNQSAIPVSQSGTWTTARSWTLASNTDYVSLTPDASTTGSSISAADTASTTTTTGQNSQIQVTGTPTTNSASSFTLSSVESLQLQIGGTWVGTLVSEISMDGGTTWTRRGIHINGTTFNASTFTGNVVGVGLVTGSTHFRVRATAWTSGTATVKVVTSVRDAVTYVSNPIKIVDANSSNQMKVESAGAANVILKDASGTQVGTNDNPIAVTFSIGADKSFFSTSFTQLSTPARIDTSTSGPYSVGNTTLTIAVNGAGQTYSFPSRGATAGYSYGGLDPITANGNSKSIKVSIDNGTTTQIAIAQSLTSGADIAAALQAAIRASVPNGSNVTVDWSVTNSGRYTVISGTTGTSSKVTITKGADNLAQLLKIGLAFGGTEATGLAANSYSNTEVATLLTSGLNDVDAQLTTTGLVELITRAGGSSATLQVTAGGSNTALGFPTTLTTGTTGTGSAQLNVNGSSTAVRFGLDIPTGYQFTVSELLFLIRDGNASTLKFFGGVAQLTNGILVEYKTGSNPTGTLLTARTNAELLAQAADGTSFAAAFSDNTDLVSARVTLVNGITLNPSSSDGIFITVRDNLTALDSFTVTAKGFLELT